MRITKYSEDSGDYLFYSLRQILNMAVLEGSRELD